MTEREPTSTLIEQLFAHVDQRHDRTAFALDGERLTFAELDDRSRRYARHLEERGVVAGDRIAAFVGTSLDMVVALLGHYRVGAIHVPINTRYGNVEIDHILEDSGARLLLVDDTPEARTLARDVAASATVESVVVLGRPNALDEHELGFEGAIVASDPLEGELRRSDEDTALLIYTSGTTGRSKGVQIPFRAVVRNIDALTRHWRWTSEDALVLALPLFHVHGLCIGIHGTLLRGCRALLHRRFVPERVATEIGMGGTIFMGVPTMYSRLLHHLDDHPGAADALRGARLFTSGSAALPAAHFEAFERRVGHRILERYGMTETLLTLSNPFEPESRKPGTVGFAVAGSEVQVQDETGARCAPGVIGEIAVRGESLMTGYWNAPDKTEAVYRDGWFMSGDVARYDEDGYVVILGRQSADIIKSGGYKISAREIEDVLLAMPGVAEIAVVGAPDEEWGQRIVAAVVPSPTASSDEDAWLEEMAAFLSGKIADYKKPRRVILLDELPRNALGKVQKHRVLANRDA